MQIPKPEKLFAAGQAKNDRRASVDRMAGENRFKPFKSRCTVALLNRIDEEIDHQAFELSFLLELIGFLWAILLV